MVDDGASQRGLSPDQAQLVVWLITIQTFFALINNRMVSVALPTIGRAFDVSTAQAGWIATLYSLMFGISTPFYGRLGNRYGLRRMYVIGLSIFVTTSLLAGIAPTFPLVVIFRIGQAAGASAGPSLGIAIITRYIDSAHRGRALGLLSAGIGAGQATGPPIGGFLTELISWRAVFLASCLVGLLIPLILRHFPTGDDRESQPIDWIGGISLGIAIAGALFGLSNLEQQGLASTLVIGSFLLIPLGLIGLMYRQRTTQYPFIDRRLLTNSRFLLVCGLAFFYTGANISNTILTPFLLENVNNLSSGKVGLALLPQAVMVTLLSRPIGTLADRVNTFNLMTIGMAIILSVFITITTVAVGWSTIAFIGLLMALGVGTAFVVSPLQATISRAVPGDIAGIGLGLYNMFFFVGGGAGAAIGTTVLAAREDNQSALLPIYAGVSRFTEFGDAYLYALASATAALILVQIARLTRSQASEVTG